MTISPKFPHVSSLNPNADIDAVRAAMAASYGGIHKAPHKIGYLHWLRVGSPPSSGFLARERDLLIPHRPPVCQPAAMPENMGFLARHDARAQTTNVAVSTTVTLAGIGALALLAGWTIYLADRRRNVN